MTMGLVQNQVGPSLRWQDKVGQVGQVDPPPHIFSHCEGFLLVSL